MIICTRTHVRMHSTCAPVCTRFFSFSLPTGHGNAHATWRNELQKHRAHTHTQTHTHTHTHLDVSGRWCKTTTIPWHSLLGTHGHAQAWIHWRGLAARSWCQAHSGWAVRPVPVEVEKGGQSKQKQSTEAPQTHTCLPSAQFATVLHFLLN